MKPGYIHGMYRHPVHVAWMNMLSRCRCKTRPDYARYGGRGIKVCHRWLVFTNFWAAMGPTYETGLTLERIDNSKGYEPNNCMWATRKAQARNRRSNRLIDTPHGKMLLEDAAKISGFSVAAIHKRIAKGWPTKDLFTRVRKHAAK